MSDGVGISEIAKGQDDDGVEMWFCPRCRTPMKYGTEHEKMEDCPEEQRNIHWHLKERD